MTERNTGQIVSEMDEKMRTDALAQVGLLSLRLTSLSTQSTPRRKYRSR